MTYIAASILVDPEASADTLLAAAHRAGEDGADLIEWRVDLLVEAADGPALVRNLVERGPLPSIVTVRSEGEGGLADAPAEAVVAFLREASGGPHPPRYVDVEHDAIADGAASIDGVGVIVSSHTLSGRPADLLQRVAAMSARADAAVAKVVWSARSLRDDLEAFDLLRERARPMIVLCMGRFGVPSRVLAPKFGGFVTFASTAREAGTAPGQITVAELKQRYRFDAIGADTRVYGIVGWPAEHSLGPVLHNAAFAAAGHDGVYLPLPVAPEWEQFKATVGSMVDHDGLDFAGASVTLPHKEHLVRFVEERGGRVDAGASAIGAANTLYFDDGRLACANTDASAAMRLVHEGLGVDGGEGRRALVLGAGGVARAIVHGLAESGFDVAILNRSRERAEALAGAFGARIVDERAAPLETWDVIVNCTPLGMTGGPDPDGDALPEGVALGPDVLVFDTVYRPLRTPLLARARRAGARTVSGDLMFVAQAAAQLALWLDRVPGIDLRATLDPYLHSHA